MRFSLHIWWTAAMAAMLMASGGCSDDTPQPNNGTDEEKPFTTYIQLTVGTPVTSRSNPTGGENGDGTEPGILHENDIHDITIFVYKDALGGEGLDNPAATSFIAKAYFSESVLNGYRLPENITETSATYLVPVGRFEADPGQRMAVVVNAGDLTAINTLGQLRTHICDAAWQSSTKIADYDHFVMSNAYNGAKHPLDDGRIKLPSAAIEEAGTREHPLVAEVWIERLAARIDLIHNASQWDGSQLLYEVREVPAAGGPARKTAEVRLTHVLPVNVMQRPSYAFKHVTEGTDIPADITQLLVCGDEKVADGTDIPVNYVVEPRTFAKNGLMTVPADWYGPTAAANFTAASFTDANRLGATTYTTSMAGDPTGYDSFTILGYANENTQHKDILRSDILTGLTIRALYIPAQAYSAYNAITDELTPQTYTEGTDLWRYSPSGPAVSDADCIYFTNREAADVYAGAHPQHAAIITCLPGGICFYNLWLKHANDAESDPHNHIPMEYAVVRNNIYRVSLTFHGPGTTEIIRRNPEHIDSRVYVRPWNFKRHPQIIM